MLVLEYFKARDTLPHPGDDPLTLLMNRGRRVTRIRKSIPLRSHKPSRATISKSLDITRDILGKKAEENYGQGETVARRLGQKDDRVLDVGKSKWSGCNASEQR